MTATAIAIGTALAILAAILMAGSGAPDRSSTSPSRRRLSR
jgi:hypothetical protein